ncbi:hypothetical protein GCM10023334_086410 [Nonomuraea thailandensis]
MAASGTSLEPLKSGAGTSRTYAMCWKAGLKLMARPDGFRLLFRYAARELVSVLARRAVAGGH